MPLPLDRLFRVLPDVPELAPLREAMLSASAPDPAKVWASAGKYSTYDKRVLEPSELGDVVTAARSASIERLQRLYAGAARLLEAGGAGDEQAVVTQLVAMGEAAEAAGDWQQAAACYGLGASLSASLSDRAPLVLALRRLARARIGAGALDEARALYRASLEQATALGDAGARAIALTGMGNAFSLQGRWAEARTQYELALELTDPAAARLRAQLQVNLSMVARELGELDAAAALLASARAAWPELLAEDRSGWHNFAGLLALSHGSDPEAAEQFTAALALATGFFERAMILDNMADLALRAGRLDDAEQLARRAEQHALAAGSPRALAEVYTRLGAIFRTRGDANGVTFFEKALELCQRHGYTLLEAAACTEYAAFRTALGDIDEASAYTARARSLYAEAGAPAV